MSKTNFTLIELEKELFGIHNETILKMWKKILFSSLGKICGHIKDNPDTPLAKGFYLAADDDEKTNSSMKGLLDFCSSTEVTKIDANKIKELISLIPLIEELFNNEFDFENIGQKEIDSLLNENKGNNKIKDFCNYYTAYFNGTSNAELNKMICKCIFGKVEDQDKIKNWLKFIQYVELISSEINLLNAEEIFNIACNSEETEENVPPKDLLIFCKNNCINGSEKQIYSNPWIYLALSKTLKNISEEEFNAIFKQNDTILSSDYERFGAICEKTGFKSDFISLNRELGEIKKTASLSFKELLTSTPKEDNRIHFYYMMFLSGLYFFLEAEYKDFEKIKETLTSAFYEGTKEGFDKIYEVLNKIAKELNFVNEIPFKNITFDDTERNNKLKEAYAELIFTFRNFSSGLKFDVINLINFAEYEQKENFPTSFEKNVKKDHEEELLAYYKPVQEYRDKLAKIDSGFKLNFRQTLPFLKFMDKNLFINREMTVKVFPDCDMKIYSDDPNEKLDFKNTKPQSMKDKRSATGESWLVRPYEIFRNKHQKFLNNFYLYRMRSQLTHFRDSEIVQNLMEDANGRKRQLLEAIYDGIKNFIAYVEELEKAKMDFTNDNVVLRFWVNSIAECISYMFNQIPEIDIVDKPILDVLFTTDGEIKEEITDETLNEIKLYSKDFPKPVFDNFASLLNFMFGNEKDLFETNRFAITFYMMYLSLALIK